MIRARWSARRRPLAFTAVACLTLGGCGAADQGETDSVELDARRGSGASQEASPPSGGLVEPDVEVDGTPTLVDGTAAVPGTWPLGDAGTVTFSVAERELVLEDVSPRPGWSEAVIVEVQDEIEVILSREGERWRFEVELLAGRSLVEIEVDLDVADAEPGTYELGDAGAFTFEVPDGWPVLTDVRVTDGWQLSDRDQDGDEFTFTLSREDRRFDVEVEVEDGRIELEIDHTLTGPVP
ncbi:hypothetical protein FTX61_17615 [Nitriliruptoraceae bacterium ZYF776]|nr:hypothetical protein [Profundirhabdus halotolerans]